MDPDLCELENCYCPQTGRRRPIYVRASFLERVHTYYPPRCLHELADMVPGTLREPGHIWGGVRDPDPGDDSPGYCFTKSYDWKFTGNGNKCAVKGEQVFCVYINSDFELFEFRWDAADPNEPDYPKCFDTRYTERLL